MTNREFDIVVFGASGFTGKHVVKYLIEAIKSESFGVKFALAGRNAAKIRSIIPPNILAEPDQVPPIIEADVFNQKEMQELCKRTRVLLNCVGPFVLYGEPVVKACIENGCDYLDITGEPSFIERMFVEYGQLAKDAGVTIIPACGFDCVPSEMAVLFIKNQLAKENVTPAHAEMFFKLLPGPYGAAGNYGTYESLIYGVGFSSNLKKIRAQIDLPKVPRVGPLLKFKHFPYYEKRVGSWVIPFLFADPAVVRLSQRLIENGVWTNAAPKPKPIQFNAYVRLPSVFSVLGLAVFGVILLLFSKFQAGRKFLLDYGEYITLGGFKKKGATPEQILTTRFESKFFVKGFKEQRPNEWSRPDYEAEFVVDAPEPGYATTPICIVQGALAILEYKNKGKDVFPKGVLTPSVALGGSNIIERLHNAGVKIEKSL
ncbi:hypothetical protein MP638_004887 [Amoeboaphelidium occidentale]|nr:hypothetical protein MP638_004887 [Amoeboaphelidium occidentale]